MRLVSHLIKVIKFIRTGRSTLSFSNLSEIAVQNVSMTL